MALSSLLPQLLQPLCAFLNIIYINQSAVRLCGHPKTSPGLPPGPMLSSF